MQRSMKTAELEVSGMDSERASRGVCSALNCIRGVAQVAMQPDMRFITLTYDATRVSARQFETAVRVMGCEVERMDVHEAPARKSSDTMYDEAHPQPADRFVAGPDL